jgi:hypothetical protein
MRCFYVDVGRHECEISELALEGTWFVICWEELCLRGLFHLSAIF